MLFFDSNEERRQEMTKLVRLRMFLFNLSAKLHFSLKFVFELGYNIIRKKWRKPNTVELQWLERLWNHEDRGSSSC